MKIGLSALSLFHDYLFHNVTLLYTTKQGTFLQVLCTIGSVSQIKTFTRVGVLEGLQGPDSLHLFEDCGESIRYDCQHDNQCDQQNDQGREYHLNILRRE